MALDPSISLGVRVPTINLDVPSPIAQMGQMMTLRGLMEQQQLRRSQIAQEEMQLDILRQSRAGEEEFRRRITAGETLTPGQTAGLLGPQKGIAYLKGQEELRDAEAKRQYAQQEKQEKYLRLIGQAAFDSKSQQDRDNRIKLLVAGGAIPAETANVMLAQPFDPEATRAFGRQFMTLAEQLKNQREEKLAPFQLRSAQLGAEKAEQEVMGTQPITPQQRSQAEQQKTQAERQLWTTPGGLISILDDPNRTEADHDRALAGLKKHGELRRASAAAAAGGGATGDVATNIADAIERGDQPPTTTGLYRYGAQVRSELGKRGYNLTTAQRDWEAIRKHIGTLNGQQQERLRQAVDFTYHSIDQIEQSFNEWKSLAGPSGFKVLNKAALASSKQLPGRVGSVAQNLEALVADFTSELGTVYKGGNASTDESLKLAAENLKADWNAQTFEDALKRIRGSLQIRRNSIMSSQPVGVSPDSPYMPPKPTEPASTTALPKVGDIFNGGTVKSIKRIK